MSGTLQQRKGWKRQIVQALQGSENVCRLTTDSQNQPFCLTWTCAWFSPWSLGCIEPLLTISSVSQAPLACVPTVHSPGSTPHQVCSHPGSTPELQPRISSLQHSSGSELQSSPGMSCHSSPTQGQRMKWTGVHKVGQLKGSMFKGRIGLKRLITYNHYCWS